MTEADTKGIDPEIERLKKAYAAFHGLDQAAQVRMLDWLTDRLKSDWEKTL